MQAAVDVARRSAGIPLLVDPKIPHIDYYAGATVDHAEPPRGGDRHASCASASTDEARDAARAFPRPRALRRAC